MEEIDLSDIKATPQRKQLDMTNFHLFLSQEVLMYSRTEGWYCNRIQDSKKQNRCYVVHITAMNS